MKNSGITDIIFRNAVIAIDTGDITELKKLIDAHPRLLSERLITEDQGYFKDPYLLYFVADNPIRIDRLPKNIVDITKLLIDELRKNAIKDLQQQLDYTLGLVVTGRIPKECGVQIEMIDLLIGEGAMAGGSLGAIAHGNIDAARHLIKSGGKLTLAVAVGLDMPDAIKEMAITATDDEKLTALTVAAFYGKAKKVAQLLSMGVNPNNYPVNNGFHSHATPLHQAVYSGSLDCVKLLIESGANAGMKDKAYGGTPLEWARHMQSAEGENECKMNEYKTIEAYLKQL